MSMRTDFADAIAQHPALPKGWRVYAYGYTPENMRHPIVSVRGRNVRKNAARPRDARDSDFSVALVEPSLDPAKVEDALEADLETLLDILDTLDLDGLTVGEAERVIFDGRFHGYDVTTTITNIKE